MTGGPGLDALAEGDSGVLGMRRAFRRKAVFRRTAMSESDGTTGELAYATMKRRSLPSKAVFNASHPSASRSCRTAFAECFRVPESA